MPRIPDASDLSRTSISPSKSTPRLPQTGIGDALVRVGQRITNYAEDRGQQDDAIDLARARADFNKRMITEDANFTYDKDQDYQSWGQRLEEKGQQHSDEASSLIRNPVLQERFRVESSDDIVRYSSNAQERGDKIDRDTKLTAGLDANESLLQSAANAPENISHGIMQQANIAYDDMVKHGWLTPGDAIEGKRKWVQRYAFLRYQNQIQSDPNTARRYLTGRVTAVDPALRQAVIGKESRGNTFAVSPKGAAGLMQIMPATAREIAGEVGDLNFPVDGNDKAVTAYLTAHPETNIRYGEHYLNQQLQRYGGDLGLALAAYNAGPGAVDDYLSTGKALPKETVDYVKDITAKYGKAVGAPPDYTALLDPEDRVRLANAAETSVSQIVAAQEADARKAEVTRKAQETQADGAIDLAIEAGDPSVTEAFIYNHPRLDDKSKAERLRQLRAKQDDAKSATQIAADLAAGHYVDPDKDKKGINTLFKQYGGTEGLISGDNDQQAFAGTMAMWKGGVMPTDAKNGLQNMLRSTDNDTAGRSLTYLDALQRANPQLFQDNFDEATEKALSFYQSRVGFDDKDAILDGIRKRSDPEVMKRREPLEKAAQKIISDSYTPKKVIGLFDPGLFSGDPDVARGGADIPAAENEIALQNDFAQFFTDAYADNPDKDQAEATAVQMLGRKWGTSEINGGMLMQYPPERRYPAIGGSHEWMTEQIEGDLKSLGYITKVPGPSRGPRSGPHENVRSYLIAPSPNYEAEIAQGVPPHYNVVVLDPKTGAWDAVQDKDGEVLSYRWDATDPLKLAREKQSKQRLEDRAAGVRLRKGDTVESEIFSDQARLDREAELKRLKPGTIGAIAGVR